MRKVAGILLLLAFFSAPVMAQDNWGVFKKKPTKSRLELGGGVLYRSFANLDSTGQPTGTNLDMAGWSGYADYRFLKWLSIGGDLSGTYHLSSEWGNTQIYNVAIGPQIYPFGHTHKLTPWGHVLLGRGFYGYDLDSQGGFNHFSRWDSGFEWMAGGGFDLRWKRRWAIRILELDYESTRLGGSGSQSQSNYRASVGLIYRFGPTR